LVRWAGFAGFIILFVLREHLLRILTALAVAGTVDQFALASLTVANQFDVAVHRIFNAIPGASSIESRSVRTTTAPS
jgi:hypothetical protein